jgi:hypothetical protein
MTKFACKGGSGGKQCHLAHDWNMCALTTPRDFIARASAHKVLIIVLQTLQMTQAMNFSKAKLKIILDIGCDHFTPNMAIIFFMYALHLQRHVSSQKHRWQFEKDISIESNWRELNF